MQRILLLSVLILAVFAASRGRPGIWFIPDDFSNGARVQTPSLEPAAYVDPNTNPFVVPITVGWGLPNPNADSVRINNNQDTQTTPLPRTYITSGVWDLVPPYQPTWLTNYVTNAAQHYVEYSGIYGDAGGRTRGERDLRIQIRSANGKVYFVLFNHVSTGTENDLENTGNPIGAIYGTSGLYFNASWQVNAPTANTGGTEKCWVLYQLDGQQDNGSTAPKSLPSTPATQLLENYHNPVNGAVANAAVLYPANTGLINGDFTGKFTSRKDSAWYYLYQSDTTFDLTFQFYTDASTTIGSGYTYSFRDALNHNPQQSSGVASNKPGTWIPFPNFTAIGSPSGWSNIRAIQYLFSPVVSETDFSLFAAATWSQIIDGFAYVDCNNDGIFNSGEAGICQNNGLQVSLYDAASPATRIQSTPPVYPHYVTGGNPVTAGGTTPVACDQGYFYFGLLQVEVATRTFYVCVPTTLSGFNLVTGTANGETGDQAGSTSLVAGQYCKTVTVNQYQDGNVSPVFRYTTPASISVPGPVSVDCASSLLPGPAPNPLGTATATGGCGAGVITYNDQTHGVCGSFVRTWYLNNSPAVPVQTITLTDSQNPTVFVPTTQTGQLTCGQINNAAALAPSKTSIVGTATSSDNCATFSMSFQEVPLPPAGPWNGCTRSYSRVWTATDACGLSSSATQYITFTDTQPPTLSVPPGTPTTYSCDQINSIPTQIAGVSGTDACQGPPVITQNTFSSTLLQDAGNCQQTFTRIFTAFDGCQKVSSTLVLTVTDDQPPTFKGAVNTQLDCAAFTNSAGNLNNIDTPIRGSLVAFDQCSGGANILPTWSSTPTTLSPLCESFKRTYTAIDSCSVTAQTFFYITIKDSQGPTFKDATISTTYSCSDLTAPIFKTSNPAPVRTPQTTDNCNAVPTVTFTDSGLLTNLPAPQCAASITRTWTAKDACGNVQQAVLLDYLWLKDTQAPQLFFADPKDAVVDLNCGSGSGTNGPTTAPTATDNCNTVAYLPANTPSYTDTTPVGVPGQPGICSQFTRTWTMKDACNNRNTINQVVRIVDNTPPSIGLTFTTTQVQCPDSVATSSPLFTATPSDDCSTAPGAIQLKSTDTFVSASNGFPTLVDNSILSPADPQGSGNRLNPCDDIYIKRTWTATDLCGRSTSVTQSIIYVDTLNPTIQNTIGTTPQQTCGQLSVDMEDDYDIFSGSYTRGDACDSNASVDFDVVDDISSTACVTVKLLTWTVTDECGNQGTSTTLRSYIDNQPPTLIINNPVVSYTCGDTPNDQVDQASDACSGIAEPGVTYDDSLGESWPPTDGVGCGTEPNTRTWYARDFCDNLQTVSQVQVYDDNEPPSLTLLRDTFTIDCTIDDNPDDDPALTSIDDAVYDEFGVECNPDPVVTVTWTPALRFGGIPTDFADCDRRYIRTFYASDTCDNQNTITQIVAVSEPNMVLTEAGNSTISCLDDDILDLVILFDIFGVEPTIDDFTFAGNSVTNECYSSDYLSFTVTEDNPITTTCIYPLVRTWTVTDPCGNSDSVRNTIFVRDESPPTITFLPESQTIQCNVETFPTIEYDDECGPVNIFVTTELSSLTILPCSQAYVRAWTVDDQCSTVPGNSLTETFAIFTIEDTLQPTIDPLFTVDWVECDNVIGSPIIPVFPDPFEPSYPLITVPGVFDACNSDPDLSTTDTPYLIANEPCDNYFIRTYTVFDGCTEPVSVSQTIWVRDNTPPIILTDYTTIQLPCTTEELPPIVPENTEAISIDDICQSDIDNDSITYADVDYGTAQACDQGTVRTFYAQDVCGNAATPVSVTFQLIDDQDPSFSSFPSDRTIECSEFRNSRDPALNPDLGTATATDNCEPVYEQAPLVTYYDSVFSTVNICPEQVLVQRTWVATDFCQRTFSSVQNIYLTVENPPIITPPPDALIDCSSASESTLPEFTGGYASITSDCIPADRLPQPNYEDGPRDDSDPCRISFVRTWYAIDLCNNPADPKTQTITIVDQDPPEWSIFPDTYYSDCNNASRDPRVTGYPVAVDDCTFPVCDLTYRDFQTFQESEDGCPADLLIYRTWIATDDCGYSITDTQILEIGVVPDGGLCPPDLCAPEECEACQCPAPTSCDCCSAGGITACTPVPCLQVACTPVPCGAVDCTPCAIDTGNASGPAPLCGPEIACIPNIVPIFVDDGDGINDTTYPYGQDSLSDRVDYWVNRADYWRDLLINGGIDFSASSSLSVSALFLLVAIPLGVFGLFA